MTSIIILAVFLVAFFIGMLCGVSINKETVIEHFEDRANTDTYVRTCAKDVLGEAYVDGDSYFVPTIEDIVDALVVKVKILEAGYPEKQP